MENSDSIGSRIDQLLGKDFQDLTTSQIVQTITGQQIAIPYEDLQSEAGFNKELEKTELEVQALIKTLEPKSPPIPISDIEDLSCRFEGDALYAQILIRSIKVEDESLYQDLINSGALEEKSIISDDIGISSNISSLNIDRVIPSFGITKFLSDKNLSVLEKINESLFDNIDPLLLGKPSNSGSRKKRELNVLGFKMPLEFIMSGNKIAHVKIGGPKITNQEAIDKINETIKTQNINSNPCDFNNDGTFDDDSDNDVTFNDNNGGNFNGNNDVTFNGAEGTNRIDDYDSNFFPDGDDPILEQDCAPGLPEDPITGDIILTKESFDESASDFCDPPEYDFSEFGFGPGFGSELNPDQPDPQAPEVDVDAIQSCIDSAMDKTKKIDDKNKELSRWQMIERSLEEIFYHYDIIYEYQKSLAEIWKGRTNFNEEGDPTNIQAVFQALSYNEQITEIDREIFFSTQDFENSKSLFLESNPIFTPNIFRFSVLDTENAENLNDNELGVVFKNNIENGISPVTYDETKQDWPISDAVSVYREKNEEIRSILIKENFLEVLRNQREELINLRQSNLDVIEQRRNVVPNINDLEKSFEGAGSALDPYGIGLSKIDEARRVFDNVLIPGGYDEYGYDFLQEIKEFSVRFKDVKLDLLRSELTFELTFMTNYGFPLPYKKSEKPGKISMKGSSNGALTSVTEPDEEKIRIGNEYAANGGLLYGYPSDYLKSYQYIKVNNLFYGQDDIAPFYDFIEDIIDKDTSKTTIINNIVEDRGILYGHLIEKSASPWLFFTAAERGDNDERKPDKVRPSSFDSNGEPNPVFTNFWGSFKSKWDAKYQQNKNTYIVPKINSIKGKARRAAEGLGNVLPVSDIVGARIFENYFDIRKRMSQMEEIMLIVSQKRQEMEDSLSPESLEKEFSDIKCAGASNAPQPSDQNDPENCPPVCCGPAGSDFGTDGNYLLSSPPTSDCPTIFQKCWWKQFCKDLTKVGLLPYPNGLPPIENTSFFLSGGPSVRLGLKYWPVGYLPPAFIPIPVPNPIDGLPYIRIPLPMIWTIIPPIIIPLPFNLGILVIFIPLIGGFMPTPLVYIKEFVTGSSLFLTGIRGPRFIPRKSDPELNDPLEKIKQALSFGIPDKLIPLPGFGSDNIDAPSRIIADIQSNFTKILDSIPPPGNIGVLRDVQEKEKLIKERILTKRKEYEKKAALLDDPFPNLDQDNIDLEQIIKERKESLKNVIKDYLKKGMPNPKSIYFPKEKDSLKIDIPGIVKSLRILKEMKASFVPIRCGGDINFKDEIREILKLLKIPAPPKYILDNLNVSNSNKILLRQNKDPRIMEDEEFKDLVDEIKAVSLVITQILLKGNKFSVVKKIRKGAFSIIEECELQGTFLFPPVKVTNSAPKALKFLRIRNPIITAMYIRIMEGMAKVQYTREDFSRYVRYNGEDPLLVIRVKDLKKLIARKIGLSKRGPFDPERPLDREEPLISKFPHPEGPLCCLESLNGGFGNAISAFELPTVFPLKSDQVTQTQGVGGIIQITIPGSVIKDFVVGAIGEALDSGLIDEVLPEINDINSPKFINLDPNDIQKIVRNMIREKFNPESPDVPPFLDVAKIPIIPPARPTNLVEQALIGLGAPPPARIVYSLFWKYFKGLPKTPLLDIITRPAIELSASILTQIPWPLTVLLGRNVVNLINPIVFSDDHPVWRRMSLKNTYYVVYLDEFLRSAADVSGLFKFFLGAADPTYPLPELPSEIQKAFNVKKY
jgi:hypothetical protein